MCTHSRWRGASNLLRRAASADDFESHAQRLLEIFQALESHDAEAKLRDICSRVSSNEGIGSGRDDYTASAETLLAAKLALISLSGSSAQSRDRATSATTPLLSEKNDKQHEDRFWTARARACVEAVDVDHPLLELCEAVEQLAAKASTARRGLSATTRFRTVWTRANRDAARNVWQKRRRCTARTCLYGGREWRQPSTSMTGEMANQY